MIGSARLPRDLGAPPRGCRFHPNLEPGKENVPERCQKIAQLSRSFGTIHVSTGQ